MGTEGVESEYISSQDEGDSWNTKQNQIVTSHAVDKGALIVLSIYQIQIPVILHVTCMVRDLHTRSAAAQLSCGYDEQRSARRLLGIRIAL